MALLGHVELDSFGIGTRFVAQACRGLIPCKAEFKSSSVFSLLLQYERVTWEKTHTSNLLDKHMSKRYQIILNKTPALCMCGAGLSV